MVHLTPCPAFFRGPILLACDINNRQHKQRRRRHRISATDQHNLRGEEITLRNGHTDMLGVEMQASKSSRASSCVHCRQVKVWKRPSCKGHQDTDQTDSSSATAESVTRRHVVDVPRLAQTAGPLQLSNASPRGREL